MIHAHGVASTQAGMASAPYSVPPGCQFTSMPLAPLVWQKHFAKSSVSGDALEKIKDEMRSGLGANAPVTDDMVSMAAGLTLVETVGVLPQSPVTGNVGVSFYCDDRGVMKGLPINRRASEIASICLGSPMQITGDTFVARVYETEEEFERRDFKVGGLPAASSQRRSPAAPAPTGLPQGLMGAYSGRRLRSFPARRSGCAWRRLLQRRRRRGTAHRW